MLGDLLVSVMSLVVMGPGLRWDDIVGAVMIVRHLTPLFRRARLRANP